MTVPGSNTQVIYNNSGNAGASSGFTFNSASNAMVVTGNVTGGNLLTGGYISATGNVIGTQFIGSGNTLANIQGANVSGTVANATYAASAGYAATVTTNAQSNITSVGTLTSLSVSGNISTGGLISSTGTITGSSLLGSVSSVSGNITGGNLLTAGIVSSSGNITAPYFIGNLIGNILITGIVSSTGNITGGNLSVGTGAVTVNNIVNGGASATGNIGTSVVPFNTLFATATTALYADLAENYLADNDYIPGTVLSFGGKEELTISTQDSDPLIAGVVSTNPAYQMNSGLTGNSVVSLALVGRVPCLVQGPVTAGAMMVSAGNGRARAESNPKMGTVIGKAITGFNGDKGMIEILVGRL